MTEPNQPYFPPNGGRGINTPNYQQEEKPVNRLPISIVAAVVGFTSICLCCIGLILGAIAIVFATQSDTKYRRQDYWGAKSSSQVAYVLAVTSLALSGLSFLIFLFFYVIYGFTGVDEIANSINSNIADKLL